MTTRAPQPGSDTPQEATPATPAQVWARLMAGNERFIGDSPLHPNQDAARRHDLAAGQRPVAAFFGCSDSRVAAEVIFDQGLGDLFVVRTAGHVVGPTELGSLEFAVGKLDVPLIVVLGHDSCGAIGAAKAAYTDGLMPSGFLRDLVERITASVVAADRRGESSVDEIEREHVRQTIHLLGERSRTIAERIEDGRLAIVGCTYALAEGRASRVGHVGDLGTAPG